MKGKKCKSKNRWTEEERKKNGRQEADGFCIVDLFVPARRQTR